MRQILKESDLYEIDLDGNIYKKENGKKLDVKSPQVVITRGDGYRKTFYIKNVIANNLIPNPNNYKKIVCKDGDNNNLHPSNIIWAETIYGTPVFDKKN